MSLVPAMQREAAPDNSFDQPTESPAAALGARLVTEFAEAEQAKRLVEPRLMQCLRQYKGVYDPEVLEKIKPGRAQVFIRHTAAKVDTTKARLMDLLFPSNGALNWEIKPSLLSSVAPESVQLYLAELQARGETPPTDEAQLTQAVAEQACSLMTKKIADQLMEPSGNKAYSRVCDRVIHNGLAFGTGILKGPLVSRKEQLQFARTLDPATQKAVWTRVPVDSDEEYKPYFASVSVFSLFPDPSALDPSELMYVWEEHIMQRAEFLALSKNPGFRPEMITAHVAANRDGDAKVTQRQTELRAASKEETTTPASGLKGRFRILERWGYLNGEDILEAGVSEEDLAAAFPEGFDPNGSYSACVWMTVDGKVLKAALAPIEGVVLPYGFFQPYKDESSFWAEGLCDRIRDPQTSINAMARMTLDHASITTLPQVAINVSALQPGENVTDFSAGKTWLFDSSEDMNSCMKMFELNSHIPEIMAIGEKFSQWSDETSTPRYMTGDNAGVRGAGDTASGLSMLMGAASLPSKDQVRQFDAITESFIEAVYNWNMKFSKDERIKGDFDIVARGSTALIALELQGRRMLEVMSILAAPMIAPKVDFDDALKHVLHFMSLPESLHLSPEKVKANALENMKMEKTAMIEALLAQAQKQGIPAAQVLQGIAQAVQGGQPAAPQALPPGQAQAPIGPDAPSMPPSASGIPLPQQMPAQEGA